MVFLFFRRLFWVFGTILLRSGFLASKVIKNDQQMLSVDELEHALELTDKNDIKERAENATRYCTFLAMKLCER